MSKYEPPTDILVAVCRTLVRDTALAVHRSLPEGALSLDPVVLVAARVADRAVNLFDGACVLLDNGQPENAYLLSRPLFEESVWLLEVANSDETQRLAYALGWWHEGMVDKRVLYQNAIRYDPQRTPPDGLAVINTQLREVEALTQERHVKRIKPPAAKLLATKHGLMCDYAKYLLSHHFVHGSLAAHQVRTSVDEQSATPVTIGVSSPEMECKASRFLCRSAVRAAKSACSILGLVPDPGLAMLELRLALAE